MQFYFSAEINSPVCYRV